MSRLQSSASATSLGGGNYKPALTVLLRQQEADSRRNAETPLSPYKNKQAIKGLGRNAKGSLAEISSRGAAHDLNRKSAKGLLKSLSAATLPSAAGNAAAPQRLAPLSAAAQQQNQEVPSSFGRPVLSNPARPHSGLGLIQPLPGESYESEAFRSLPPNSYQHSHYYKAADAKPSKIIHVHQYPDGSVVEDCTCERGHQLVEAEQRSQNPNAQPIQPYKREEEKQATNPITGSPVKMLAPSQIARANIDYARQMRPVDTSRHHSVYAAEFKNLPTSKFSKLGRGYFASHNKSYIRSCMQDPGYGFQLEQLRAQSQNDPQLLHYASEISREHTNPDKHLRNIIPEVNWPTTTHHHDFAAPSADLIRSYKRVGTDYRQSMNKSYIRMNLVDQSFVRQLSGVELKDVPSSVPSSQVKVPFTADTTHQASFLNWGSKAAPAKASVTFGGEAGPAENIWANPWDDNRFTEQDLQLLQQQRQ